MEGIARQAGVTKPVVYDLFGSLADLLEALLEREEERALNQLAELMPTPAEDADPAKVLVDGLDAFLRAIETRPDAWRLSLLPIEAQPGIVREQVERDRTAVAKQLASIVRWGVERLERADLRRRPARPDHHAARRAGRPAPPQRPRDLLARADHGLHGQPPRERSRLGDLVSLNSALERIADTGSSIASMVENVRSMSGDTRRISAHSRHLDSIDERLDRIVELMERMVASVDELRGSVQELEEHIEPVGRLAGRFPGRSKR